MLGAPVVIQPTGRVTAPRRTTSTPAVAFPSRAAVTQSMPRAIDPSQPPNTRPFMPGNPNYRPPPAPAPHVPGGREGPSRPVPNNGTFGWDPFGGHSKPPQLYGQPQSPGGREGVGYNNQRQITNNDPYLAYLYGQGNALFGEQGLQNQYLNDQYNSQTVPRLGLSEADLRADAARQRAAIDSSRARNNVARRANESDAQYAERQLREQLAAFGSQRGFNVQDADFQRQRARSLNQQAAEQFGIGSGRNTFVRGQQDRADRSDATARGAIGSLGYAQDMTESGDNYRLAQRATQLGYDSDKYNIGYGLSQGLLGIDRSNAGLDAQTAAATTARDKAVSAANFSGQLINQLAVDYGVNTQQINGALDRGLDRLGLDAQAAKDALAEAQRVGNAQALAAWNQLFQTALTTTPPTAYKPTIPPPAVYKPPTPPKPPPKLPPKPAPKYNVIRN